MRVVRRRMPNHKKLRVGDKIRILSVPESDLIYREQEIKDKCEDAGWTANTIELVIAQNPIVTIARIDEYQYPWFDCTVVGPSGEKEEHSLTILDNKSWEYV